MCVLVPLAPVVPVTIVSVDKHSVKISWPMHSSDHGPISSYDVVWTYADTRNVAHRITMKVPATKYPEYVINGLHTSTKITVLYAATNDAGTGPYSASNEATTKPSGKTISAPFLNYVGENIHCNIYSSWTGQQVFHELGIQGLRNTEWIRHR